MIGIFIRAYYRCSPFGRWGTYFHYLLKNEEHGKSSSPEIWQISDAVMCWCNLIFKIMILIIHSFNKFFWSTFGDNVSVSMPVHMCSSARLPGFKASFSQYDFKQIALLPWVCFLFSKMGIIISVLPHVDVCVCVTINWEDVKRAQQSTWYIVNAQYVALIITFSPCSWSCNSPLLKDCRSPKIVCIIKAQL